MHPLIGTSLTLHGLLCHVWWLQSAPARRPGEWEKRVGGWRLKKPSCLSAGSRRGTCVPHCPQKPSLNTVCPAASGRRLPTTSTVPVSRREQTACHRIDSAAQTCNACFSATARPSKLMVFDRRVHARLAANACRARESRTAIVFVGTPVGVGAAGSCHRGPGAASDPGLHAPVAGAPLQPTVHQRSACLHRSKAVAMGVVCRPRPGQGDVPARLARECAAIRTRPRAH